MLWLALFAPPLFFFALNTPFHCPSGCSIHFAFGNQPLFPVISVGAANRGTPPSPDRMGGACDPDLTIQSTWSPGHSSWFRDGPLPEAGSISVSWEFCLAENGRGCLCWTCCARRLGSGAVGQVKVRAVPFPTAGFSAGMSHLGLFQSTLFWVLFLELGSP